MDLLDKNGVAYQVNNRKVLGGLELDIWIPKHRVAIEINGLYWHSDKFMGKDYHYQKAVMCKRKDIVLLQFWDYEIKNKFKIVSSILRSKLGRSTRVFARSLEVQKLEPTTARTWFTDNHLQGAVNSLFNYGLVDSERKILCAMSFARPRFSKHEWELTRMATAPGHTVVGGASRLLAAFTREVCPTEILSYADLRYSQGNVYKSIGMRFSHKSAPNYFYYLDGKGGEDAFRISRYAAQKHKLGKLLPNFDPKKTEEANMKTNGYRRVFDAGNLVFVKHIKMIDQHAFA